MYGTLRNIPIKPTEYTGKETDTTVTTVDNRRYTIEVDVKDGVFSTVEQLETEVFLREKADREIVEHIDEAVAEEAEKRAAADNDLSQRITAEAETRAEADNDLSDRIQSEAQTRAEADNDLSNRLNAETTARVDADNDLSDRLRVESEQRQIADQNLLDRLVLEEQARSDADTDLSNRLESETQSRIAADNDLQTRISTEKQERQDADAALLTRLQQEETTRQNQVSDLDTRLNTEATKRANADTDLSNRLNAEKTAREAEDNNILGLIADEVRARSDADGALSNDIQQLSDRLDEESSIRTREDQAIRQSLQQEVQDRQDADSNLEMAFNSALQDEAAERQAADIDLEQKIAEEAEYRQQEDQALSQSIESLQNDFNDSGIQNTDGYIDIQQLRGAKRFTVNASQQLLDLIRNKWSYQVCTNAENTPEGVTWVDEQQQTITGTLVASADTMFKFYLVKGSGEGSDTYEEYITVFDEQNYSWEKFGGADIDLSNYAKLDNHDNVTEFLAGQFIVSADESTIESASVSINSPSIAINGGGSILIDSSTEGNVSISGDSVSINSSSGGQTFSVNPNGAYLNNSEIALRSDLNGYATENWVEQQNYLVNTTGSVSETNLQDGSVTDHKVVLTKLRLGSSNTLAGSNFIVGKSNATNGSTTVGNIINGESNVINNKSNSIASGKQNTVTGSNSQAFGLSNTVSGNNAHAEGYNNTVSNAQGHAEGSGTESSGNASHTEGVGTIATEKAQHAQGQYNVQLGSNYTDIVGAGSNASSRKNISVLSTSGDLYLGGNVYVSATNDECTAGSKVATESWVTDKDYLTRNYTTSNSISLITRGDNDKTSSVDIGELGGSRVMVESSRGNSENSYLYLDGQTAQLTSYNGRWNNGPARGIAEISDDHFSVHVYGNDEYVTIHNYNLEDGKIYVDDKEVAFTSDIPVQKGYSNDSLKVRDSTSGCKGWYFAGWDQIDDTTYLLTLVNDISGTPADPSLFEVGDILSAKAGFSGNFALKVTGIQSDPDACKLSVQYTYEFRIILAGAGAPFDPLSHLYDSLHPGYVWNPSKPGSGSVQIGCGAMAIGSSNSANEWGSLAIGNINLVDGRYAFANGESNLVAYGSAAIGHNNSVYAYDALAVGAYNTLRNWRTAAFGASNSMNAINGFASGHGNQATNAAHDGLNIRGCFATTQSNDTFIDVVGCGTDADHRKNVLAVSKSGSLRIKGDIFVNCNNDSSGGTNLRTLISSLLPTPPTTDGDYMLACDVRNGVATYSWVERIKANNNNMIVS